MSLSDFADRQSAWLQDELTRRSDQMKREFPRPFGQVEVPKAERIRKLIDFRVTLTAGAQGDEQAIQTIGDIREQFGLNVLVTDFLQTNQEFETEFKEGEGG